MAKFIYHIVQTNQFEVEIEAADEDAAQKIFDEYLTEDFGDPVDSSMVITGPIELGHLSHTCCTHEYESACACCMRECDNN